MTDSYKVVERPAGKEALRALLHLILFHRLFGCIKPRTTEIFDLTLPAVDEPEIDNIVNIKIDQFWKTLESSANSRAQMIVVFSEKRTKKSWFTSNEEEVPWEKWIIEAQLTSKADPPQRNNAQNSVTRSHLQRCMQRVLEHVDEKRDAVPPIQAQTLVPFPMSITVPHVPVADQRATSAATGKYGR
ncbi:DUF1649-domain-containing protein [Dacryopinax primogenitus]|uniref:Autophagy-related protein 101 n=1 Tax=Dacryopinax primogenitus (strain DJM 731) TaxID=1858805 RepID=M5G2S1_DACPD|nr:DUF1649-domain-containing protein [Dacryopinax primogenitus]EJU02520.1 DUF1649-domain-containing protein [Dacryopinax primogenitus]